MGGTGFEMSEDMDTLLSDVNLLDNKIENIKCYTNEVPLTLVTNAEGEDEPVQDVRGAVLQLVNTLQNERIGYDDNNV